jgi:hypothetical protein
MPVICIDARLIEVVANHTFVPADARANEQSVRGKSALPPTPDIHFLRRHVRFVPIAAVSQVSLDNLISAKLELQRHVEAKRLRGLEVKD